MFHPSSHETKLDRIHESLALQMNTVTFRSILDHKFQCKCTQCQYGQYDS